MTTDKEYELIRLETSSQINQLLITNKIKTQDAVAMLEILKCRIVIEMTKNVETIID